MSPETARVLDLLEDMTDVLTEPRPTGDASERLVEYARRLGAVGSYVRTLARVLGVEDVDDRLGRSQRAAVDETLGQIWRERARENQGRGELFGERPDGEHAPDRVAESLDAEAEAVEVLP